MKDNFVSPLCYGGCMCGQNGCSSCGSYAGLMEQTAELLQTLRSAMYPNMFGCNLGNGARLRNAVADCVMPQMAEYLSIIEMFWRLFSSLNMLSWANLLIPVMKTNRR